MKQGLRFRLRYSLRFFFIIHYLGVVLSVRRRDYKFTSRLDHHLTSFNKKSKEKKVLISKQNNKKYALNSCKGVKNEKATVQICFFFIFISASFISC